MVVQGRGGTVRVSTRVIVFVTFEIMHQESRLYHRCVGPHGSTTTRGVPIQCQAAPSAMRVNGLFNDVAQRTLIAIIGAATIAWSPQASWSMQTDYIERYEPTRRRSMEHQPLALAP